MNHNAILGRFGENVAADHLRADGLVILARNWRCSHGEIDIIAREGDTLVVCEVKTRTSTSYGTPEQAVGPTKAARLRRLTRAWLEESGVEPPSVRIDVVSVLVPTRGEPLVERIAGVA